MDDDEFDDADGSWGDEGEWSEADAWSDDEPTVACPYCGEEMLEDAPQCSHCGNYISAEDHQAVTKPRWVVVTAILCLIMAVGWLLAR